MGDRTLEKRRRPGRARCGGGGIRAVRGGLYSLPGAPPRGGLTGGCRWESPAHRGPGAGWLVTWCSLFIGMGSHTLFPILPFWHVFEVVCPTEGFAIIFHCSPAPVEKIAK